MQARHLSTALLTLGVLVGVAASVGLALGFEPAKLPAALLKVAAYKLTFLAALGLLAAGALVARHAGRPEAKLDGLGRTPAAELRPDVGSAEPARAPGVEAVGRMGGEPPAG